MRIFIYIMIIFTAFSCADSSVDLKHGVYFWENDTQLLTEGNKDALDSLNIERFYVKLFEVDREDGKNKPVAKSSLKLETETIKNRELIPCVFILNKVFIESSREELDELAMNVTQLTKKFLNEKLSSNEPIPFTERSRKTFWCIDEFGC